MNEIFKEFIITFLTVLATGVATCLIKLLNAKIESIAQTTEDEKKLRFLNWVENDVIVKCINTTTQTYVQALKEQDKFKEDVRKKGEEYLNQLCENDTKAIVLAGRPYHLDNEINHGIDTMINSLGLAVLTEDSICHLHQMNTKLRVVDQWTYHSRIYYAADVVSQYNNLELVNLNSFGCGLDAIVTDQTEEILRKNNKLFTTIKIDEINNLGAAKIRIRSLIASMNKRDNLLDYKPYTYKKNIFKEEHKGHTLLFPDMSPNHMPLFEAVFKSEGYHAKYLNITDKNTVDTGLKDVATTSPSQMNTVYANDTRASVITDLKLPAQINSKPVVEIADNAFQGNTNLTNVVIPDSVITIGKNAFWGCSDLDITIPHDERNVIYGIVKDNFGNYIEDAVVKLVEITKDERNIITNSIISQRYNNKFGDYLLLWQKRKRQSFL